MNGMRRETPVRVGPESTRPVLPELPHEFEQYLPQTLSRPEDLQRYLGASPAWVHVEYERTSRMLLRFAEAVVDAMESPRCAHNFLQRLDLRAISRDHNWRRIFAELVDRDPCFDGHKRSLVLRYLQFLSERQRLLAYVEAQHAGLEETSERARGGWEAEPPEVQGGKRLGVGETELLEVEIGAHYALWMGGVRVTVCLSKSMRLSLNGPEGEGFSRELRLGRNLVGRHPECDLPVPSRWRTISRVHALLDWERDWRAEASSESEHLQGPSDELAGDAKHAEVPEANRQAPASPPRPSRMLRVTNLSSRLTTLADL